MPDDEEIDEEDLADDIERRRRECNKCHHVWYVGGEMFPTGSTTTEPIKCPNCDSLYVDEPKAMKVGKRGHS